ncbi:putative TonB-linked outer membrane protein [Flavobacteria bacterium BAL38]|nr:putative TonB-linked outer membrane protein [Flavobacteria bacterium BAL38]
MSNSKIKNQDIKMKTLKFTLTIVILFLVNITYSQDKNVKIVSKKNDPLIVVNDSILKYEVMEFLNPNDIESVTVWKDEKAKSMYGENGKNGVIVITTKNISKRKLRKIYKQYKNEL